MDYFYAKNETITDVDTENAMSKLISVEMC